MKTISTLGQLQARTANLRRLENDLITTQQEVATGKPSDLGRTVGSEYDTLLSLRNSVTKNDAYLTSIGTFERRADVMVGALSSVESAAVQLQSVLATNIPDATQTVSALGTTASSTLAALTSALSTTFDGRYLFSGLAIDSAPLTETDSLNAITGLSPQDVIDQVLDGTAYPVVQPAVFVTFSAAEAATAITRINEVFDGTNAAALPPLNDYSFEQTTYGGALGTPPVSVRIDEGSPRTYGISAEDQPFRDLIQGAIMLKSVDLVQLAGTPAYTPYVTEALNKISAGLDGLREVTAGLGGVQQEVSARKSELEAQHIVLNDHINRLENVDQIEAQTRFAEIEKQLDASYASTVRVMSLRLTNYL